MKSFAPPNRRWAIALLLALVLLVSLVAALSLLPARQVAGPAPGPRTVFVHLFEWKWTDIAQECENFLGPKDHRPLTTTRITL